MNNKLRYSLFLRLKGSDFDKYLQQAGRRAKDGQPDSRLSHSHASREEPTKNRKREGYITLPHSNEHIFLLRVSGLRVLLLFVIEGCILKIILRCLFEWVRWHQPEELVLAKHLAEVLDYSFIERVLEYGD